MQEAGSAAQAGGEGREGKGTERSWHGRVSTSRQSTQGGADRRECGRRPGARLWAQVPVVFSTLAENIFSACSHPRNTMFTA